MGFQNVTNTQSGTALTFRTPSPALWATGGSPGINGCPWERIVSGELSGIAFYDDFRALPLAPTLTTQIAFGQYKAFATSSSAITGSSVVNSVDVGYPNLNMTADTSAHSSSLAIAYPGGLVSGSTSTSGPMWFEARVATSSITTLHQGFFVGLAETSLFTLATGVPFSSSAAAPTNSGSFLGFFKPAANTTTWSTVYNDRATSFTNVGASDVVGIAANTFTKIGLLYDPYSSTKAVRFFQDNIELANFITPAQITATTNLKANSLAPMIALVGGSAASSEVLYTSWMRWAFLTV